MIVSIDARFVTQNPRGIGIYSQNLILGLLKERPEWKYNLYIRPNSPLLHILKNEKQVIFRTIPSLNYFFEEFIVIPLFLFFDRPNIFHATGNTGPFYGPSLNIKFILTLHDVSFMKSISIVPWPNSWYQRFGRVYRRVIVPLTARYSDNIIAVSDFAANDIRLTLGKNVEGKVRTCFLGFDLTTPMYSKHNISVKDKNYAVVISGKDPQKNIDWLLTAFLEYRKKGGTLGLKVVGVLANEVSDPVLRVSGNSGISFLGYVNNNDTLELINKACLLLFPSLYESFGIPIVEAFKVGTPVLAANTGAAPEIGGNSAQYFKTGDISDFVKKLIEIEKNNEERAHLSVLGRERALLFTQKRMALRTIKIYEDACGVTSQPRIQTL
jgi:glycosyltransferase involved in cell wall biosynthesis